MRYITLLIFWPLLVQGKIIKINYQSFNYKMNLTKQNIFIKNKGVNLKITKRKCNEIIFNALTKEINENLRRIEGLKFGEVKITLSDKEYRAFKVSSEGQYFLSLSDEILKVKIASDRLCKK